MNETLQQALNWRYAVKKFDPQKKVSDKDWQVLENSLVLAPSSYGLQPWKFLVVQNPQLRTQLREASWGQSQVTDCSHYVVLTYKKKMDEAHVQKYVDRIAFVRGVSLASLDGYKNMMIGDVVKGPRAQVIEWWAQKQTYIAMGFIMEAAALLKIDACPMEGLDPKTYDKILKLENTEWATVAAVAVGYRHAEDALQKAAKVRFENKDVVQFL
ncbi:NAD(P)H-dependent oxidoreductase [bacterium]|nr:NAD(P)H-dependent oxidoreductase [bacterium]